MWWVRSNSSAASRDLLRLAWGRRHHPGIRPALLPHDNGVWHFCILRRQRSARCALRRAQICREACHEVEPVLVGPGAVGGRGRVFLALWTPPRRILASIARNVRVWVPSRLLCGSGHLRGRFRKGLAFTCKYRKLLANMAMSEFSAAVSNSTSKAVRVSAQRAAWWWWCVVGRVKNFWRFGARSGRGEG